MQVEVDGQDKAKQHLEPTAAADGRQAAGYSSLGSSPSSGGLDASWTGAGTRSTGAPLVVPTPGSQCSSTTLAATGTVASATLPLYASEAPHAPQALLHQYSTAMYGTGAADKGFHHLPHFMATNALIPEPVTPAPAATDLGADAGWQRATAGQQPSALGVAVSAGDAAPSPELGGNLGSGRGKIHLTDGDLLDVAAVFMGEEGRAWRAALEKEELL